MTIRTFIPVAGFALVAVLVSPAHGLICQGKSLSLDETVDVINAATRAPRAAGNRALASTFACPVN